MECATPMWIAGSPEHGPIALPVTNPYDGSLVGSTSYATDEQVERAIATVHATRDEAAALPIHARAEALLFVSAQLEARTEEIAQLITAENGKPLMWSRIEVTRAAQVFRWAAETARQWSGEMMRLDTEPSSQGRLAYIRRVPTGAILAISPFNFPLNLAAHKVAPAIAVGAPIVLKPAPKTPLSGLLLGELLAATNLPSGMVSVLNVPDSRARDLVADPRLPVISFTGSGTVGKAIREQVPHKHVTLELGGNAAVYVAADYARDGDLDYAAQRIAIFANYQAGQSCVGVQRVYLDESLYADMRERIVRAVESLAVGDPLRPETIVGPLINDTEATRVEHWVAEAVRGGAIVLTGGTREGASIAPTVLEDVGQDTQLMREEVFGPVLVLCRSSDADHAFAQINASRYGLQAGIFSRNLDLAFRAHRELEVGGVIIGDVPSFRADQMPYGGSKDSGVGREGVRFAMEDFTEQRVMVLAGLEL